MLSAAALQALRWEAIHDGTAHVAAKGTARPPAEGEPGQHRGPLPVAVGSRLTDPWVRPVTCNRTRARAEPLAQHGAKVVDVPRPRRVVPRQP